MGSPFTVPLSKSLIALVQTFGGPLVLVAFHAVPNPRRPAVVAEPPLARARLDLDKAHFIDPLPAEVDVLVAPFVANLVESIGAHMDAEDRTLQGVLG